MLLEWLDDLDNYALEVLVYLSLLVMGVVLSKEGFVHVTAPATAWLGDLFGLAGMTSGLLSSLLTLVVVLVGLIVLAGGIGLLVSGAMQLLDRFS